MPARRKTGEKPQRNHVFVVDRLPQNVRDYVVSLHTVDGKSWQEIEELSPSFLRDLAPESGVSRLSHSSLHRWYDVRVHQLWKQNEERAHRTREFMKAFASRSLERLPQAVQTALSENVFSLMEAADAKNAAKFRGELLNLGFLLAQFQKVEVQREKVELEKERLAAAKDKTAETDPRELYLEAAQDVLKKLRSRKAVREVIDPIREELIAEFAHGAEAFAKSIETRKA